MNSKEDIENIIRNAVKDVLGITSLDKSASLIDRDLAIVPVNFLYIFEILEKGLQLPVYNIFIDHTYEVMTIEKLTNALFELQV